MFHVKTQYILSVTGDANESPSCPKSLFHERGERRKGLPVRADTHHADLSAGWRIELDGAAKVLIGYLVGRWEDDTLVVDAVGFNDQGWLDAMGHPQSEDLRIRERFRRCNFGHMDLELTIEDPKMYTEPFTVKATESAGAR